MPVTNPVTQLRERERDPRVIDPRASLETQVHVFQSLINGPPRGSRVITITPALATWILTNLATRNRKPRAAKIHRFAADMKAGKWMLTGDTIKFSRLLEDGQNRLAAVVRANVPIETHVVFGISTSAFDVIDTGTGRTNADILTIVKVPHARHVAQAVRWLMIYQSGNPQDRSQTFTNAELYEFYQAHVDEDRMQECVVRALKVGRRVPIGSLAAHLYMFIGQKPVVAGRFAADLATDSKGARKLLNAIDRLKVAHFGRVKETIVNALIVKAWMAYCDGRLITAATLKWDESKDYPDFGWAGISTP